MELGEYATNVLSNSNFASIPYEYYALQNPTSAEARSHMRKVEVSWRKDGALVYCDLVKGGIWRFRSSMATGSTKSYSSQDLVELQGRVLLLKDQGVYEPSSLTRGKGNNTASNLSASSTSSSPSSSIENTVRNAQSFNARAVQANSNQSPGNNTPHEPQPQPAPSPSTKSDVSPAENILHLKWIHEQFISAVLSSLVYFLCRDHNFLPLNARTLVVNPAETTTETNSFEESPRIKATTLVTLDISLTSLGTLVVKAHCDTISGLRKLKKFVDKRTRPTETGYGTPLWLAPGGHAAKYHGEPDDPHFSTRLDLSCLPMSPTNYSQSSIGGTSLKSWKIACLDWLASKGLNTKNLDSGGWTMVRIIQENAYPNSERQDLSVLDDRSILPWPTALCFQNFQPGISGPHSSAQISGNYDPLNFAEEWFLSKEERNMAILKRQKERQKAEATSREQADVESRNRVATHLSPVALRRGSNAGAIYPTPPDAIHQPVGATPSFDGTVSTPGQQTQLFANDTEMTGIVMNTTDADNTVWTSGDPRPTSTKPNVHFNDHDQDNDNDNLFGDMGGDLFGDTDITDADFSFFDEPDAVPPPQNHVASEDLIDNKSSQVEAQKIATPSKQTIDFKESELRTPDVQQNLQSNMKAPDSVEVSPPDHISKPHVDDRTDEVFKAPAVPAARVSPPFTKETVFKLLFEDRSKNQVKRSASAVAPRRASAFNKIDFDIPSFALNEKYSSHGRFNYAERKPLSVSKCMDLPKTQYLQQRQKPKINGQDPGLLSRIFGEGEMNIIDDEEFEDPNLVDDSESTGSASEQEDTSLSADNSAVVLKAGIKRKREGESVEGSITVLTLKNGTDLDPPVMTPLSSTGSLPPILDVDPADWSLTPFLTTQYPDVQPTILSDAEYMATAQILADQAVSSTLSLPKFPRRDRNMDKHEYSIMRQVMQSLEQAIQSSIDKVTKCTMRSFLDIQGIPVLSQALRLPPRPIPPPRGPNSNESARPNNIFPLQIPRLEVRRSDTNLTILPSAISFWDNLGLGPSPGAKDISAVCIYPAMDGVLERASIFLDEISTTYESSRFGSHERITSKEQPNGLMPLPVDSQQTSQIYALQVVKDAMAQLSKVLISSTTQERNLVVYCIYPPEDAGLLVHICSSFEHLFNLYRRGLAEKKAIVTTELVLQLVPLDFVASPTSLMVPKPTDYGRLAMEVYDRCMDFTTSSSVPAILLERPLPKGIDFKLNANPSPSLLQENSCLHIAYAQSVDDRWITAAWTDNRGSQQMTASYCLGRKNEPISLPFSEVAHEIWETTLGILSHKKIHWRLMIVKVGVMNLSEIEFWTGLASTESDAHVNLTLTSVNTDPSLQLIPEPIKMPPSTSATQSVLTPVSTPQAVSILSPENATTPMRESAGNPATPNEAPLEPDSDARLIDLTDQSWGAVASHRLNNSNSLLEFNPALISGYLIKRSGTRTSDAPIVLEVNLMHSDLVLGNPRTFHEGLLREIISYYRGLATIARVRGVVDGVKDGRPWHIAAAEKAVAALYMLM